MTWNHFLDMIGYNFLSPAVVFLLNKFEIMTVYLIYILHKSPCLGRGLLILMFPVTCPLINKYKLLLIIKKSNFNDWAPARVLPSHN